MTLEFDVVQRFKAAKAISGSEREFKPGETFLCDTAQQGATITIEFGQSLFVIEHSILDTCCKRKIVGPGPFC